MTEADRMKLVSAAKKYPKAGRVILQKVTGLSKNTVQKFLNGAVKMSDVVPEVKKGKTIADFRNQYDKSTIVPARVKTALKELGASGWEYEIVFLKMAGVSATDLSNFREMFAGYIVNLKDNKRAWAGSEKTASIMREMI